MKNLHSIITDKSVYFFSVFLTVLILLNPSVALAAPLCPDGSKSINKNCADGVFCGVCPVEISKNSFFAPKIQVVYRYDFGFYKKTNRQTVTMGECEWMNLPILPIPLLRVCARTALAGAYGNDKDVPQLCAYEDMCDYTDPISGSCFLNNMSIFHEHTSYKEAQSILAGGTYSFMTGGDMMGIIGAGITHVLTQVLHFDYNLIVNKELGCVPRPVGPNPPAWCHNCWDLDSLPDPTVKAGPNATFFNPAVSLDFCTNANGISVGCNLKGSVISLTGSLVPIPPSGYNPDTSSTSIITEDCETDAAGVVTCVDALDSSLGSTTDPVYEDCKKVSEFTTGSADGRKFCARITTQQPDKICVYQTEGMKGQAMDRMIACIPRPGYMPRPEVIGDDVSEAEQLKQFSSITSPGIRVKLGDQQITLVENPNFYRDAAAVGDVAGSSCKLLHQTEMCAYRPCLRYDSVGKCTMYDIKVCVSGYSTPPGVIATIAPLDLNGNSFLEESEKVSTIIPQLPNSSIAANTNFENEVAIPQMSNGVAVPAIDKYNFSFFKSSNPPACHERDSSGKCLNYSSTCETDDSDGQPNMVDGKCVDFINDYANSAGYAINPASTQTILKTRYTSDPFFYDTTKYMARPLSAEELKMCVGVPLPSGYQFVYNADAGRDDLAASQSISDSIHPVSSDSVITYSELMSGVLGANNIPEVMCSQIEVEVIGGGASGSVHTSNDSCGNVGDNENGSTYERTGGGGGYIKAKFNITTTDTFKVDVGRGGRYNFAKECKRLRGGEPGYKSGFYVNNGAKKIEAGGGSDQATNTGTTSSLGVPTANILARRSGEPGIHTIDPNQGGKRMRDLYTNFQYDAWGARGGKSGAQMSGADDPNNISPIGCYTRGESTAAQSFTTTLLKWSSSPGGYNNITAGYVNPERPYAFGSGGCAIHDTNWGYGANGVVRVRCTKLEPVPIQ